MSPPRSIIVKTFTILLVIEVTSTAATSLMKVKSNAHPVHEVINEQSRIDNKARITKPPVLPYGNPLAGNSQQNARIHAQNQQAMFNAERVRQHRAQLQRWTKAPIKMDSYMKAYHESQENHQIALEKQQSRAPEASDSSKPVPAKRQANLQSFTKPDVTKLSKADAVVNKDKNRNHRSYGSDYQQYIANKRYQNVHVSPASHYEQGVTIKPHGNVGIGGFETPQDTEPSQLYTSVLPKTQYIYPKQEAQMQSYKSAQDIEQLSTLLQKDPNDQLTQLKALLSSSKSIEHGGNTDIEAPIDLYFYLKDSKQNIAQSGYEQLAPTYASAYANEAQKQRDHTPITEEIDDIADPNKNTKIKAYGLHHQLDLNKEEKIKSYPVVPVIIPQQKDETTTTKSNNYYKVEVASQTISSGYRPHYSHKVNQATYQAEEDHPQYEYQYPKSEYVAKEEQSDSDLSQNYLHHNGQFKGIQHIGHDGTGVSAYGDDSENLQYAANYEFGYRVKDHHSGNDFGHQETKNGEKTDGHYHVLLPDGRMQQVHYSAGPEGFHADISYDHLQYKH